jgi:CCR4-NOT transcription complex subunit 3
MSNQRKLQGEIDKCLKKVTEGVEVFDDIWQKVHHAANTNQKDKYETDLKKEIKKLQRLRDQIKTWLASSDIKDKKPLMENRKLIEQRMERFKVVERETKTKAYSKEGLGQAQKVDPATKEREEVRAWLNDAIERLNQEVDQFEYEIQSIHAQTKKKKLDRDKQDRVDELQQWVERHTFHTSKLETIMRMWDNCTLETKQVKSIEDSVNYYIESSQEPDFMEDEGMYDDLEMDDGPTVGLSHGNTIHEEDHGPLSPATRTVSTPLKSTSQELLEERRKGRESISEVSVQSPKKTKETKTSISSPTTTGPTTSTMSTTTSSTASSVSAPQGSSGTGSKSKHHTGKSTSRQTSSSSTVVANGPQSPVAPAVSKSSTQTTTTTTRPSSSAYAAAASGQTVSSPWSTTSGTSLQPQTFNSMGESPKPPSSFQPVPSGLLQQDHQDQEQMLHQGVQSVLSNHQTTSPPSSSNGQGHIRNNSSESHSTQVSEQINSSPISSLQSPSDSVRQVNSLQNSVPTTPLSQNPPQNFPSSSGVNNSVLTVDTTYSTLSSQPSASSPIESLQSLSSPVASISVSNGQSTSSSPRPSLTGLSGQNSQNDVPVSQGVFPSSGMTVLSSVHQPMVPSPAGLSGSPEPVSAPLSVMTTLSGPFSSAPQSMPSPTGSDNLHQSSAILSTTAAVGSLPLGSMDTTNDSIDTSKLPPGGLLTAALESASVGCNSELSSSTRPEIYQQPLNPLLGVTPLGPLTLMPDHVNQLHLLEAASKHLPQPSDSERVRTYLQRNPYPSPVYHCQHAPPHMDSFEFFQRLNTETLFFIFYYMEGTKAQYLSAKALKKQSWRFHTKYLMWFQRHEEPKTITDEYEMGTYIYFDFEKWAQRKKEGFTFEYRFLEDKDLP